MNSKCICKIYNLSVWPEGDIFAKFPNRQVVYFAYTSKIHYVYYIYWVCCVTIIHTCSLPMHMSYVILARRSSWMCIHHFDTSYMQTQRQRGGKQQKGSCYIIHGQREWLLLSTNEKMPFIFGKKKAQEQSVGEQICEAIWAPAEGPLVETEL